MIYLLKMSDSAMKKLFNATITRLSQDGGRLCIFGQHITNCRYWVPMKKTQHVLSREGGVDYNDLLLLCYNDLLQLKQRLATNDRKYWLILLKHITDDKFVLRTHTHYDLLRITTRYKLLL